MEINYTGAFKKIEKLLNENKDLEHSYKIDITNIVYDMYVNRIIKFEEIETLFLYFVRIKRQENFNDNI